MSAYFSKRAIKSIEKIGDVMIPGDEEYPSFSVTGSVEHIDDIAAWASEEDIKDLNMVLNILSYMPGFVIKWFVKKMYDSHEATDGTLTTIFRQLDFGLRGLIFSCYYSGKTGRSYKGKNPLELLGYSVNRIYA